MFKRVERKRKQREEEEELGLDEDAKAIVGLNDTDSDESDSDSEQESEQSDSVSDQGKEDRDQGEDEDEDEGLSEESPISIAEALKDPIYLISLEPTVHGCVLCRGKLIKNAGMAAAHRNANMHKRRFEHFKQTAANADLRSNAWVLVKLIQSAPRMQKVESQGLSKRALKRRAKQATVRERRRHHKELKAKAMATKARKKLATTEGTKQPTSSDASLHGSRTSQNQLEGTRKKRRLESESSSSKTQSMKMKSVMGTKASNKELVLKPRLKDKRKVNRPS